MRHGTYSTYERHKCRCDVCKDFYNAKARGQYVRKGRCQDYGQETCAHCSAVFTKRTHNQRFCKSACTKAVHNSPQRQREKRYGMTYGAFEEMLTAQSNSCAVCGDEFTETLRPCLDHCHVSGRPRAVLCSPCNTALGMLKESPYRISSLLEYTSRCA